MYGKKLISALMTLFLFFVFIPKTNAEPNNWSNWSKAAINWGKASIGQEYYDEKYTYCLRHVCACYRLPNSLKCEDNAGKAGFSTAIDCEIAIQNLGELQDTEFDGWKNAPPGSMLFFRKRHVSGHVVLYLGNGKIIDGGLGIGKPVKEVDIYSGNYRGQYSGWAYPYEGWERPSDDTINKWANSGGSETININVCSIEKAEYGGYEFFKGVSITQKLRDELNKGSFTLANYNDFFGVDPNPDNKKTLRLWFNNGSSSEYKEFQENQSVQFNKVSCGGGGGGACTLPAPTDLSPADGAEVKNDSKLRWKHVEGKTNYTLYFYNSAVESDIFGNKKQPQDNEFTIRDDQGFVDGKKYYWRVAANCSGDKPGTYSVYRSFVFKSSSVVTCPAPEIMDPKNEDTIDKLPHTFKWDGKASKYRYTIYDDKREPIEGYKEIITTDKSCEIRSLPKKSSYHWKVTSICGSEEAESGWVKFYVKEIKEPDPPKPEPNCKAPELYSPFKDTSIDSTDPIDFEWEAVGLWEEGFPVKSFQLNIYQEDKENLAHEPFDVGWDKLGWASISYRIPSGTLVSEKKYYWSVSSICPDGSQVESPERRSFTIKAPPRQPPVEAPILHFPKDGAFYELNISFYSALRGMSAKYPDGLDRSNISFKFMLEITNKEGFRQNDESDWLNVQLRESNLQEWLSKKAYDLWRDQFLGDKKDEKVEYTFKWYVIARNDISLERKQSDTWTVTLVDGQPPPEAPILLTPGNNSNDEIYSLSDPVCYSALRSMSAKYPDDKDHSYISFQFHVEIIGEEVKETSNWVNNWDDANAINWPPIKMINYRTELLTQNPLPEVDLTFQWRVTARNNITMQEKTSEYRTFKIVHKAKCNAPKQVKPKDGESIKLPFYFEWEKVDGAKEYKLRIYNHKKEEVVASYTTYDTTFQISSLEKNKYYYWTVTSICSNGTEEESSFLRFLAKELCKVPIPKEPTGNIFEIRPEFIWEGASDISKYIIEIDGNAYDCNQDSPMSFDWDLSIGSHQWRIKAICTQGEGDWSEKLSFTIEETPCEIPTPVSPSGRINENQPNFYWNRVENVLYYQLELKGQGLDGIIDIKDKNGKALNPPIYFGTAFENGRYKWRVRTICKNGTSGWSKYLEFIVDAENGGQGCKLPPPTLVSPSENADVTLPFQVKWSYVQGNKGYKLRLYGHNYDLLWEKTVNGESYTFSTMNEFKYGAGGYRWSVATICENKQVGSESQKRTFWLEDDNGNGVNRQKFSLSEMKWRDILKRVLLKSIDVIIPTFGTNRLTYLRRISPT